MKKLVQITFFLLFPIFVYSQEKDKEIFVPFSVVEVPLTNQECGNIEYRTKRVGNKDVKYIYKVEEYKKCIKNYIRNFVKEDLSKFSDIYQRKSVISANITINSKGEVTDVKTRSPHENVSLKIKEKLLQLSDFTPASQRGKNVGCLINVAFPY